MDSSTNACQYHWWAEGIDVCPLQAGRPVQHVAYHLPQAHHRRGRSEAMVGESTKIQTASCRVCFAYQIISVALARTCCFTFLVHHLPHLCPDSPKTGWPDGWWFTEGNLRLSAKLEENKSVTRWLTRVLRVPLNPLFSHTHHALPARSLRCLNRGECL